METDTKVCVRCKEAKPADAFQKYGKAKRKNTCLACETFLMTQRVGSTYQTYLTKLHQQSKSKRSGTEVAFHITVEDLIDLWEAQEGRCALSGVLMTHHKDGQGRKDFNASMDRIIPDRGYILGNVQLVCDRVNLMRHTLSMDMFYWWIKCLHDQSCD